MIKAKNISKSFGENNLFSNLNFEIATGDKVCITADSGKGKSTLLKILLGLESIDAGEISINNLVLNEENIDSIRKLIAWFPQELAIHLQNGEELIEILTIEPEKFINNLNKLGLQEKLLKQSFQNISGGQKQRMLIAACLSLEKPILILDEPTSALDKNSIHQLIDTIQSIKDLTVISVSHNLDWINSCNKLIQL